MTNLTRTKANEALNKVRLLPWLSPVAEVQQIHREWDAMSLQWWAFSLMKEIPPPFSLAKSGSVPARAGQWQCQMLISSLELSFGVSSLHEIPPFLPHPELLLHPLLQLGSSAGNHSTTGKLWPSGDPQGLWHHGVWCQGCGDKIKAKEKNHPILNRTFFFPFFHFSFIFFFFYLRGLDKVCMA